MVEIPEEIMERAKAIPLPDAPLAELFDAAYEAIAHALLAERAAQIERDACIADMGHERIIAPERDRETAFATGELIAQAIREQKQ